MRSLLFSGFGFLCAAACARCFAGNAPASEVRRHILICTGANAPQAIRAAAEELAKDAAAPLLKALTETQSAASPIVSVSEKVAGDPNLAAFNHLIVIGLRSSDPLLDKGWDHYATIDEATQTCYAQGWGYLKGDIGYIESDRNPFLHSSNIKEAPFETVIVKITGTSEAGVLAALKEFRASGLLNGFVPAAKWERPQTTILDLDPALELPDISVPKSIALNGNAPLAGWVQVPGNEYRAILEAGGIEPVRMWRFKYFKPNALDHAAADGWLAGIHRMAYGNCVDIVQFKTEPDAKKCRERMCRSGWKKVDLAPSQPAWQSDLGADEIWSASPGRTTLFEFDKFVILSTLPDNAIATLKLDRK